MGITADTIGVDVVGHINRLSPTMGQAERIVDQSAARMDRRLNRVGAGTGGGFVGDLKGTNRLLRGALTGFGAIQAARGAIGMTPVVGAELKLAFAALRGDSISVARAMGDLDEAIKKMPFGIGELSSLLDDLFDKIGGGAGGKLATEADLHARELEIDDRALATQNTLEGRLQLLQANDELGRIEKQRELDIDNANTERNANIKEGVTEARANEIRDKQVQIAELEYQKAIKAARRNGSSDSFSTAGGQFKIRGATSDSAFHESEAKRYAEQDAKNNAKTASNTTKTNALLEQIVNNGAGFILPG